jgi:hypothetical protein
MKPGKRFWLTAKFYFRLISSASLGLLVSLYLASCSGSSSNVQRYDTQLYQVNGAVVCDHLRQTYTYLDDCDYSGQAAGYYYNSGSSSIYYRSNSGEKIVVERNKAASGLKPGGTVSMSQPVLTDAGGTPLMRDGSVIKGTPSSTQTGPIKTTPVRSTASFSHPSLGKVVAGKTTSVSRGMSFGGRSSSVGRSGG